MPMGTRVSAIAGLALLISATAVVAARQITVPAVVLPTARTANVFFARTMINGAGPFWLTIDTGATLTVLDPATVRTLGLPARPAGQFANVGVGEAVTDMATTTGVTLKIGEAPEFAPVPLYVVSVGANAGFRGQQIDGVLGTDFLRRFVVEFDYAANRVLLHQPGAFEYRGPGERVPMTVQGNVLLAAARLSLPDGEATMTRLLVDTGSSQGLSLNSPFVARHRLAERLQQPMEAGATRRASVSIGINGVITSQMIKLPSLAFGSTAIAGPDAALSTASEGLTATDRFDGIIGAALLRDFRVIVDYPRREIVLERIASR